MVPPRASTKVQIDSEVPRRVTGCSGASVHVAGHSVARGLGGGEGTRGIAAFTPARLKHLWQAAWQEVPRDRWAWYSFATFEILDPQKFGGDVWLDLEGDWIGLLHPLAFEDEPVDDEE